MKKFYLLFLTLFLRTAVSAQEIVYVTQTGGDTMTDGKSWATAYNKTQLQTAITNAASGSQIWVARGTYTPTLNDVSGSTDTRDVAFIMKQGVSVYGGFVGADTETTVGDRDFSESGNATILSGDFANDDVVIPVTPADTQDVNYLAAMNNYLDKKKDNAYHVVLIIDGNNSLATPVLDGLVISGGYADGIGEVNLESGASSLKFFRNDGGGMVIRGNGASKFSLNNVKFIDNVAKKNTDNREGLGGALYIFSPAANPIEIKSTTFNSNIGANGGAVFIDFLSGTGKVSFSDNCEFKNNSGQGGNGGGAIMVNANGSAGTVEITSATFENNTHRAYGGAIRSTIGTFKLNDCTFTSNSSARGAIYNTGVATLEVVNSKFDGNSSTGNGGHIYVYTGTLNVKKSRFLNGSASSNGGAIFIISRDEGTNTSTRESNVHVSNSIFYNNIAKLGGAVYLTRGVNSASPTVASPTSFTSLNNTFFENKDTGGGDNTDSGGAIYFLSANVVTLKVYNSIFSGNLGGYQVNNGNVEGFQSDFRRGQGAAFQEIYSNLLQITPPGNFTNRKVRNNKSATSAETLFYSVNPSVSNFLYLKHGSPCIDEGDNTLYDALIDTNKDLIDGDRIVLGKGSGDATIDLGAIEWNATLPVKINTFDARRNNKGVLLSWKVGVEDNVNRYIVQRSTNGIDFVEVAIVPAIASSQYTVEDKNPAEGTNYYRLISIDNDGSRSTFAKLNVVNFSLSTEEQITIYPNPVAGNELNVLISNFKAGNYHYQINNTAGALIKKGTLIYNGQGATKIAFDAPAGVYVLSLKTGDKTFKLKVIKK